MRPQAGVGKLKHAPPMQASDLPLVAQAVPPANYIFSHLLRERLLDDRVFSSFVPTPLAS